MCSRSRSVSVCHLNTGLRPMSKLCISVAVLCRMDRWSFQYLADVNQWFCPYFKLLRSNCHPNIWHRHINWNYWLQALPIHNISWSLFELLTSKRNYTMQLRPKGHNFTLPHIHTTLLKNSFINRCIFGIVRLLLWLHFPIVYITST